MTSTFRFLSKHAWLLHPHNHSELLTDGCEFKDVTEVYTLELPAIRGFNPAACTFESAFNDTPVHRFFEAAYQSLVKAVELYSIRYNDLPPGSVTVAGPPIELLIEAVLAKEPNHTRPSDYFGNTPEDIASRPYLRGIPDNHELAAYRIWVLVRVSTQELNFERVWREQVFGEAVRRYTNFKLGLEKERANNNSMGMNAYEGHNGSYSRQLKDTERWMLIHSEATLAEVWDMILGFKAVTRPDILNATLSGAVTWERKPINIRARLSPFLVFQKPRTIAIDPSQDMASSYLDWQSQTTWRFPKANRVVRVSPTRQNVLSFHKMLLPEYQARVFSSLFVVSEDRIAAIPAPVALEDMGDLGDDFIALFADADADNEEQGAVAVAQPADADSLVNHNRVGAIEVGSVAIGSELTTVRDLIDTAPMRSTSGALVPYDPAALEREDFDTVTSLTSKMDMDHFFRPETSAFHFLYFFGRFLAEKTLKFADDDIDLQRVVYERQQQQLLHMYSSLCGESTSDVSDAHKRINQWREEEVHAGRAWLGRDEPLADPSMTMFGNTMVRYMAAFEDLFAVLTGHLDILLILFASLDAYRLSWSLKPHTMMAGKHSTGKSFALLMLIILFIAHTVKRTGKKTSRADNSEHDRLDEIHICEEGPPDQLRGSTKRGNDAEEADFKDWLTSMTHTLDAFNVVRNRRSIRTIVTTHMAVVNMATNLAITDLSDAIRSRFFCIEYHDRQRMDGRYISDVLDVKRETMAPELRALRDAFIREVRSGQFFQLHTEKLIAIKALPDVTLGAFRKITQIFGRYLQEHHHITILPRVFERVSALVRKLVIQRATDFVFSQPGSKHWKKPFDWPMMLDLSPYLHDTDEVVYFALEMYHREMVSEVRMRLSEVLSQYLDELRTAARTPDDLRKLYLMPETPVTTETATSGTAIGSRFRSFQVSIPDSDFHVTEPTAKEAKDVFPKKTIYSYVVFPTSASEFQRELTSLFEHSSLKLSSDQVGELLNGTRKSGGTPGLKQQTITTHPYVWDNQHNRPVAVRNEDRVRQPLVFYTKDMTFVHLSLFNKQHPVEDAILHCARQVGASEYRYIRAQANATHPGVLEVWPRAASNGGERHQISTIGQVVTPILGVSFEAARNTPHKQLQAPLNQSFNELSHNEHAKRLFYKDPSEMPSIEDVETAMRVRGPAYHVTKKRIEYPAAVVNRSGPPKKKLKGKNKFANLLHATTLANS